MLSIAAEITAFEGPETSIIHGSRPRIIENRKQKFFKIMKLGQTDLCHREVRKLIF